MKKLTHSFEVHWNESSCRKKVRLGLEQVICASTVYLMKLVSLMLNISIDIENGAPDHGKYFLSGLNASNKRYLRENLNMWSKNITTTCEIIGVLNSTSISPAVIFSYLLKYI